MNRNAVLSTISLTSKTLQYASAHNALCSSSIVVSSSSPSSLSSSCLSIPPNNHLFAPKMNYSISFTTNRFFSSNAAVKRDIPPCPFETLGVSSTSEDGSIPYSTVKKAFFKLALQFHPDTADKITDTKAQNQDPAELFHQIRTAFESIIQDPDNPNMAILRPLEDDDESNSIWKDNREFDSWFQQETGHHAPFMFEMDPETMREVAEMTENNEGGGLDRGGMWHLAKMVSQNYKDNEGSGGGGMLQLDAGEIQEEKGTRLSRRRRRPR